MPKRLIYCILIILLEISFLSSNFIPIAYGTAPISCTSDSHYTGPPVIVTDVSVSPSPQQTGQDINITLSVDTVKTQFNGDNFAIFGQSNQDSMWSNPHLPLNSSGQTTFTIRGSDVKKPGLYTLQLRKDRSIVGPIGVGALDQICNNLTQISVFSATLAKTSCSFSLPANINNNDSIKTTVTTTPVPGANYYFYIFHKNSVNETFKKILASPGALIQLTDADNQNLNNPSNSIYHSSISLGPSTDIDAGKQTNGEDYVALGLATGDFDSSTGTTAGYVCDYTDPPFSVSNGPTTASNTTTTLAPPGTAAGSSLITTQPTFTKCDPTIDITKDPNNPLACSNASGTACNTPSGPGTGILTAIGCIPTDPPQLIAGVLKFATGISGGIALLMMAFGAIGMITSAGNAEALKNSQQRFYNAIIGLMLIILSVFLLQLIGVDILKIPGFGR